MTQHKTHRDYESIYRQVLRVHRQYFLQNILLLTIEFLTITLAVGGIFLLIHLLFDVNPVLRTVLSGILLFWYFAFTVLRIFPNLKELLRPSQPEIYRSANRLGSSRPEVRDGLVNYLQIYQNFASQGSSRIKELVLIQLLSRLAKVTFPGVFRFSLLWKKSRLVLAGSILLLLAYLAFPNALGTAALKVIFPWRNYLEPLPLLLTNSSGSKVVLKNDPVLLTGKFTGDKPLNLFLVIQDSAATRLPENSIPSEKIVLNVLPDSTFEYRLNHVQKSFAYYFVGELTQPRFRNRPAVSSSGRIQLRARPIIRNLQAKISPPAYTGLPARLLSPNEGEITALRGSKVDLHIECDKQLKTAVLVFSDSSEVKLQIAGHTASGAFKVGQNLSYKVHILDADSIGNSQPVAYNIYPLSDEMPFAEIKQPGADLDLGEELMVRLLVDMRDDYGFSSLWLQGNLVRAGSGGDTSQFRMKLPYRVLDKGKAYSEFNWDLMPFFMVPDDYIQYQVEVWDNDAVSGPKKYGSSLFTIRLPSLLEMLEREEKQQENQREDVKDIVQNSKEIKEKLEELQRELKRESEVNWEQKQAIKEQLGKHQQAMDKLTQIEKELEETLTNLDQNKMLSPETLEKYLELQKMMQELATPEMKAAMEKLQEALEKASPEKLQKAMEQFQMSLEQFEQSIERTYELLKRVQLEQKMDELVNLAEKMKEEQAAVNKKLEQKDLSADENKQLQAKEKNIENEAEYLEKEIGETTKEFQDLLNELSELLQKSQEFMAQEQMQAQMQEMQNQMSQGKMGEAEQSGEKLQSKMEQLQKMLEMARQSMNQQQKQMVAKEMQKTMHEMLGTSFLQEKLAGKTSGISAASPQVTRIASEQMQVKENTRRLIDQLVRIGNQTFFLSPQLNQLMTDIKNNIDVAIASLENRNLRQASGAQKNAMGGLNQAILSLQNSQKQMSESASASGFQEMMQQMQQLSGQQGQLNQESMSMFQKGQNGRIPLSSDELGRLAAQQEMIRDAMEQLGNEMGDRRDVLGRMGELGEEMEKVVKDLKAQQLDRKVIERQERILSRLLDAQKSVREKEFSRKRQAERENTILAKSPPDLKKEMLQREDQLRKQLMEALEEGYTPEYRELIKLYYETLSREPLKIR